MRLLALFASLIIAGVATAAPEVQELGKRSSCTRPEIRKEWRKLTSFEQQSYLKAISCLARRPHSPLIKAMYPRPQLNSIHPNASYFDDIVYLHMDLSHVIHNTGLFLPWHRWFVHAYSQELKNQCGYRGPVPYWDTSLDVDDFENSPLFDSVNGFGGWGNPDDDYQITDGPLKDIVMKYPIEHRIRRRFEPYPYVNTTGIPNPKVHALESSRASVIAATVAGCAGDYNCFHNSTEPPLHFHIDIHRAVQGDLAGKCPSNESTGCAGGGPTFSPNDPLFFLHHANVDRVWAMWQDANPKNKNAFDGGSAESDPWNPIGLPPLLTMSWPMPTSGLFEVKAVVDVMDTMGGYLCYKYV